MDKTDIINNIHTLVSNNVIGDKQAMSRYKGFRGELFFDSYIQEQYPSRKCYEGGIIISKDNNETSLDNSLYLSVISENEYCRDYLSIFKLLSSVGFEKMYLITYSLEKWKSLPVMYFGDETITLPVPEIKLYEYNPLTNSYTYSGEEPDIICNFFEAGTVRKRNKYPVKETSRIWLQENLLQFTNLQLLKIYMNRLFLDGYIGFSRKRGKPSDIDLITKKNNKFSLIEIKEKDLPKKNKRGFGLDVPRLQDLQRISGQTSLPYYLIVREIDNQTDRNLVGWKYIMIDDFVKDVKNEKEVTGGIGMRSDKSENPTLICSYNLFKDF